VGRSKAEKERVHGMAEGERASFAFAKFNSLKNIFQRLANKDFAFVVSPSGVNCWHCHKAAWFD
jgi:hypothetical protein